MQHIIPYTDIQSLYLVACTSTQCYQVIHTYLLNKFPIYHNTTCLYRLLRHLKYKRINTEYAHCDLCNGFELCTYLYSEMWNVRIWHAICRYCHCQMNITRDFRAPIWFNCNNCVPRPRNKRYDHYTPIYTHGLD